MINHYPAWKYILLVLTFVIGVLYALPNLYGEDFAVQISATRGGAIDSGLEQRVLSRLEQFKLKPKSSQLLKSRLLLRFDNDVQQLQAKEALVDDLGHTYVVALNLAPSTPEWLLKLNAQPMYLGLDLRGGIHFLLEVDMAGAIKKAEQRFVGDLKTRFRSDKVHYKSVSVHANGGVAVEFRSAGDLSTGTSLIRQYFPELQIDDQAANIENGLILRMNKPAIKEIRDFALQQNITTLRNRVNELGVAEPVIQQQGNNRIVVELPGIQDSARAKQILNATATLEFRMVDDRNSVQSAVAGQVPPTSVLYRQRNGQPVLVKRSVMLTGDRIVNATSGIDQQSGTPAVFITLDGKGASLFSRRTRDKIGRPMATIFIENKSVKKMLKGKEVTNRVTVREVINVATIRDQLGKRFQITGLDNTTEARDLALLLRAGALAAPIDFIEERTVGPSLGQQNIDQGFLSVEIGFALVLLFMLVFYKLFGLVANLALTFNLVMIVAVLSMLQATLTLPGIAGVVLTVGMAVDANVLIFERIKEELRIGNSPHASIHAGYEKAFSTIADANITTLIAALLLFGFGTGPIKGFAITLSIGIATSMFTAIMGTRAVINLIYGGRRIERLSI